MRLQFAWITAALLYAATGAPAIAQPGPAPQTPPAAAPAAPPTQPAPPAAPAEPAPSSDVPPPPPPSYEQPPADESAAGGCTPACRSGFVCEQGQCVSACNPPCPGGQRCTAQGECAVDPNAPAYFAAPVVEPGEPAPVEGLHRHDGLMIRATLGIGGGTITREDSAVDFVARDAEFTGGGLLWSIDVGGSPIDNLVLHGRISQSSLAAPETTLDGDELGTVDEISAGSILIGPAVSYYFMPINLYATLAAGLGVVYVSHEDDDDYVANSDAGIGLNVDLGKEWSISANWALGVAARFVYTNAYDEEAGDAAFESVGGGLQFSATYQ